MSVPIKLLYTKSHSRLRLIQQSSASNVNLVLVPGGPGMGSEYFYPLINGMHDDCSIWTLDLIGNGDNQSKEKVQLAIWPGLLNEVFEYLDNVILLGHSFGGMMMLVNADIENKAKGFILMSTVPKTIFSRNGDSYLDDPVVVDKIDAYFENRSDETFKNLVLSLSPFYFDAENIEYGRDMLQKTRYAHLAYDFFMKTFLQTYAASYIPKIPTLILSGDRDIVTPIEYFEKDIRFQKNNIKIAKIAEANHFPWINNLSDTVCCIEDFIKSYLAGDFD